MLILPSGDQSQSIFAIDWLLMVQTLMRTKELYYIFCSTIRSLIFRYLPSLSLTTKYQNKWEQNKIDSCVWSYQEYPCDLCLAYLGMNIVGLLI